MTETETKPLYKYTSFDSAMSIIRNGKMLLRHPGFFNDPFDCHLQNTLAFKPDIFADYLYEKSRELLINSKTLPKDKCNGDFIAIIKECRVMAKTSETAAMNKLKNKTKTLINGIAQEGVKKFSDPKWKELMNEMRILCLSEKYDNILMWSHYASDHEGAVIGIQAPLVAFEPVNYVEKYPEDIQPEIFWAKRILGQAVYNEDGMYSQQLLTKSLAWKYEEEWRIIIKRPANEPQPYASDVTPLMTLHLGCKMSDANKQQIASLALKIHPDIKIYEGQKHYRDYILKFNAYSLPAD